MDVHLCRGGLQSGANAEPSASRSLRLGKAPGPAPGHLSRPPNHSQNGQQGKGIKPPTWFFSSLLEPHRGSDGAPGDTRLSSWAPFYFCVVTNFVMI